MINAMNVKCSRCLHEYSVEGEGDRVVGICPTCDNVEGYKFEHPFTFEYNAGGSWYHRIAGKLQLVTPDNIDKVDGKYYENQMKRGYIDEDCKCVSKVDSEDGYDWDWLKYDKGRMIDADFNLMDKEPEGYAAHDQDKDFIYANLGWD